MQDLLIFNLKKLKNTNKPQLRCVLPPTVALMSHPTAQITLPCEAAWFVRSHENPALVYYIPCPEYKAQTLRDGCWSGNSIEKSLPVDGMNFFLMYDIHSHIAQLHCNPAAAYSNQDDGFDG